MIVSTYTMIESLGRTTITGFLPRVGCPDQHTTQPEESSMCCGAIDQRSSTISHFKSLMEVNEYYLKIELYRLTFFMGILSKDALGIRLGAHINESKGFSGNQGWALLGGRPGTSNAGHLLLSCHCTWVASSSSSCR